MLLFQAYLTTICILLTLAAEEKDDSATDYIIKQNEKDEKIEDEYFEGDIDIMKDEEDRIVSGQIKRDTITRSRLWPKSSNGMVYIPYYFAQGALAINHKFRKRIKFVAKVFKNKTCIRLIPRQKQKEFIIFFKGKGCFSYIGKTLRGGRISLGNGCGRPSTIIHEIMHSLGFFHEQSRKDRDEYVRILWQNIKSGKEGQFKKYDADPLGYAYDRKSIMHYGKNAFGIGNNATIIWKANPRLDLGGNVMTSIDSRQINALYKCTIASEHERSKMETGEKKLIE